MTDPRDKEHNAARYLNSLRVTPGESMPTSKELDGAVLRAGTALDDAYRVYFKTLEIEPWQKAKDAYVAAIEARLRASLSASPEPQGVRLDERRKVLQEVANQWYAPGDEGGLEFDAWLLAKRKEVE